MSGDWKAKAEAKRDSVLNLIPEKWRIAKVPSKEEQRDVTGQYIHQFLSKREIEITETDAVGIAKQTASGSWSAVEVTEAFCHRAALAHQLVNCLHEIFFDAAIESAKELDAYLAEHKKPKGPMHGVPVSLKDQFHLKGVDTHMGYVGWIGTFEGKTGDERQGNYESEMVRELRNLGAVLFCKTSVPHTLMSGETVNNIIGYTWNPKNRNLCSGGSSGGEGALIGLRGSPVGFGTDIGGSIRIPAAFNGLYGLRPSGGRLPYEGMANTMDGQNSVLSVVGPLGTTAGAVRLATKSILSQNPWLHDPLVVEIPWRDAEEEAVKKAATGGQLAFGYMISDGIATPQPPVVRAIKTAVEAVQKAGHKVIEWKPPAQAKVQEVTYTSWGYDGGKDLFDSFDLSGEPPAAQIATLYPGGVKDEMNASQIAKNNREKRQVQKLYMDYWNSTASQTGTGRPIDGIIAPLAPYAAARPERYKYYGFSVWVNGLDWTSVVVPVTMADKKTDTYPADFKPTDETDKGIFEDYDAEIYDKSHVSVQIVGRRFTEEKMLAIAEYVGGLVGK